MIRIQVSLSMCSLEQYLASWRSAFLQKLFWLVQTFFVPGCVCPAPSPQAGCELKVDRVVADDCMMTEDCAVSESCVDGVASVKIVDDSVTGTSKNYSYLLW